MSEQETTPGHSNSNMFLVRVIMSKPSPERERLMSASRSALLKELEVTKTEASQPPIKQSVKKRRSVAPAVEGVDCCLLVTVSFTMSKNFGHDFS
ncbi:uncharacterized protein LOC123895321 [Trifolium pratense]|uniref:Uncharacterized protein n=1 Tax=Trifolium pratense TaxID=57577 RepID=A0ACB0K670_TRIPR|nr:uncharacterized protein LOC123895321 [Trifolium pratense]XP_045801529.1 uncharacterized protein LOC123895321 [Trifolium pratense]CAJ2651197.1 unnamed protein product [Trifolium pratense]